MTKSGAFAEACGLKVWLLGFMVAYLIESENMSQFESNIAERRAMKMIHAIFCVFQEVTMEMASDASPELRIPATSSIIVELSDDISSRNRPMGGWRTEVHFTQTESNRGKGKRWVRDNPTFSMSP